MDADVQKDVVFLFLVIQRADLTPARKRMAGTVLGGKPVLCGGKASTGVWQKDCRIFNPLTRNWDLLAEMSIIRGNWGILKITEESMWCVGEFETKRYLSQVF